MKLLEKIFSVKNKNSEKKIITLCFIKFTIPRHPIKYYLKKYCKEQYEKSLYLKFRKKLHELKVISEDLKPQEREECFDRYFINDYVKRHKKYIKGDILEFCGGNTVYAQKYNEGGGVHLMAFTGHKEAYPHADYFADLEDKSTLPDKQFDCIIATQVIMYMSKIDDVLQNLKSMLKENGVLILTVPGPIFHHSKNSRHMFSFTEESMNEICKRNFGENNVFDIKCYGNLEYAMYNFFWMKKNPYEKEIPFDYYYTLVIGTLCKK